MVFEPSLFIYSKALEFLLSKVGNVTRLLNFVFINTLINNTGAPFITLAYNGGAFIISIFITLVTPAFNLIFK